MSKLARQLPGSAGESRCLSRCSAPGVGESGGQLAGRTSRSRSRWPRTPAFEPLTMSPRAGRIPAIFSGGLTEIRNDWIDLGRLALDRLASETEPANAERGPGRRNRRPCRRPRHAEELHQGARPRSQLSHDAPADGSN